MTPASGLRRWEDGTEHTEHTEYMAVVAVVAVLRGRSSGSMRH